MGCIRNFLIASIFSWVLLDSQQEEKKNTVILNKINIQNYHSEMTIYFSPLEIFSGRAKPLSAWLWRRHYLGPTKFPSWMVNDYTGF